MGLGFGVQLSMANNLSLKKRNTYYFTQKMGASNLGVFNDDFLDTEQKDKLEVLINNEVQNRYKNQPSIYTKLKLLFFLSIGIVLIIAILFTMVIFL